MNTTTISKYDGTFSSIPLPEVFSITKGQCSDIGCHQTLSWAIVATKGTEVETFKDEFVPSLDVFLACQSHVGDIAGNMAKAMK